MRLLMTTRSFSIPSWAPMAAIVAILLWAVSIWWMVATLPASASGTTTAEEGVSILADDIGALAARVDELGTEIISLREERAGLLQRITELEAGAPMADAFPADAEKPAATVADDDVTKSPFFTNGQDKYSCRAFKSYEEAQEALRVNGPGDPNKIDTNKNGIACEDIKFPTPTPTATPKP
jgi:hypothetical protein